MTSPTGRIRPTRAADFLAIRDPGHRQQAILADIAAQRQANQQQQQQATRHDPEVVAKLDAQIKDAENRRDFATSIALKQTLKRYLSAP